jgi:hypothetical protein
MNEGLWGFIGVIIGSVLSIVSQYFIEMYREKSRNKNEFIIQIKNIEESIHILKKGIKQFLYVKEIDITKYSEEEIYNELNPTLSYFASEIINIWPELKQNIIKYFPSIFFDEKYKYLEYSIGEYYNIDKRIKINVDDVFINYLEYLKEKNNDFNYSLLLINKLEITFLKTIKKIRKII